MTPMYLNDLFNQQAMEFNLRDNLFIRVSKIPHLHIRPDTSLTFWIKIVEFFAVELRNTEKLDDFRQATMECHSSGLNKLVGRSALYLTVVFLFIRLCSHIPHKITIYFHINSPPSASHVRDFNAKCQD